MKKDNNKKKWLITIIIISFVYIIGLFIFLYFTNSLDYIVHLKLKSFIMSLSNVQKWFVSGSIIAIIIINIISNYLYGKLFPGHGKGIKEDTEKIIEGQNGIIDIAHNINNKIDNINDRINIDPRKINSYIKQLPISEGKKRTINIINKLYNDHEIEINEKYELLDRVDEIFEILEKLTEKIKINESEGKKEAAKILEENKKYYEKGNAEAIKNNYYEKKKQNKKDEINILKNSIELTDSLFAYDVTEDLYKELIKLEPTEENYFNFAYFYQKYKVYNKAGKLYEEALHIYRELAKENPRTYLPYVATTLNNLAVLHKAKNEYGEALEKYEEALQIRRELAKENPRTYLPYVATTLNNLAILKKVKNEYGDALEKHEEALKIYRELALENPRTYDIDYAKILIMGVAIFGKDKDDLKKARKILVKYPDVYEAQKLIGYIERL